MEVRLRKYLIDKTVKMKHATSIEPSHTYQGFRAAAAQTEDAYAYPEEHTDLETFSPELTEPVPEEFFKGVEKIGAFEDISNGSDAETTIKSNESVTTTSPVVLSDQNQTSEAAAETSQLYTDATTMPVTSPTNDTATNATVLSAQTEPITEMTPPIMTTLCSETSTDLYNETITKPTTPLSSSDATTMTSDLHTNATTPIVLHTESTTKLVAVDLENISESTSGFSTNAATTEILFEQTTSDSEPTTNIIANATTANIPDSENSTVLPLGISDLRDFPITTDTPEESNKLDETSTQPSVFSSSSDFVEPERSTKDTLEQLYDEDAAITTEFTPRYEEGYHDPKRAPTRYAQHEEYITTTHWRFSSDYGIGIRDYNLILYAVNNSAVLEKGSLLNYVYFVFKEVLHVNMTLCDIRYCRYLRSKTHDNTKKVPPVLVAFTKMDVKNEILHKRKLLKPTGIKVEHDMPKKILEEQNALLKPLMDKYRAMGQYVVVRSGKLLVEGKVLTQINLPDKYTYDPLQTYLSYVSTTAKPTTVGMQLPREIAEYGFGGDKKSGKKKKGAKGGGGKKKRKPMIRIPLDDEIGHELSVDVLFTTRRFWL